MTPPTNSQAFETLYRERFNHRMFRLFLDAGRISGFNPGESIFWLRTWSRQKGKALTRRRESTGEIAVPPILILSSTSRCNLRCKGCYAKKRIDEGRAELSPGRIRTLFEEASALGVSVILIAGGEPLMRPGILQAASLHKDIIFPVFTNGTLLDRKTITFFRKHRNLVPILSTEGGKRRTEERRGQGIYGRTIRNMEQMKKAHILFGMSCTLTSENYQEVTSPDWLRTHYRMGSRLFFMVDYVPQAEADMALCLTAHQKMELPDKIKMLRKVIPSLFISLPGDEQAFGGCLAAGRGFLHISPEGNLEPCPFAPYSDTSLINKGLRDALSSPFMRSIREHHNQLGETTGGCTLWENRKWVDALLERDIPGPPYSEISASSSVSSIYS